MGRLERFSPLYDPAQPTMSRAQDDVRRCLDSIIAQEILGGEAGAHLLQDQALTYGQENLVEHKLGRAFRGWIAVRVRAKVSRFSAYQTSNQAITTATWTTAQLGTESYDHGGDFDAASSYAFTAPEAGLYRFEGYVYISNLSDGVQVGARLNTTPSTAYLDVIATGAGSLDFICGGAETIAMASGDTAALQCYHAHGSDRNLIAGIGNTRLTGELVGRPEPWQDSDSTADLTKFIPLWVDRSSTVDLWVW